MHKRPILYLREPDVDTVLQRQLAKEGYRILPKVGLSDALVKDRGDYLSQREFDYFTRAHLDFLVTCDNMPVFAVEFDGVHHFLDDRTIENDVIKNRLCKHAGLPLLRVTSSEIKEYDKITLLDYMLLRYVAWGKEYPLITQEIKEFVATIGPDSYPDDPPVQHFDPSFHFDLRHPFPAREIVLERLWRNHRIAWTMVKPERHGSAEFLCDVTGGSWELLEIEQFNKCTRRALAWRPNEHHPVFSIAVSITLRSWLPLRVDVPSPDLSQLWGELNADKAQELIEQFEIRVKSMWLLELPGISVMDIAQNYTEYLGLRAVEQWAKKKGSR